MKKASTIAALFSLCCATPLLAQEPLLPQRSLASDVQLASVRGKFLLPNGVELAMTVQTDTSVDGQLLLRSVFSVDAGPPRLSIYSPAGTQTSPGPTTPTAGAPASPADIWVSFDRDSGESRVERDYKAVAGTVTVNSGKGADIGTSPDGAQPLALAPGQSIATGNGLVSLDRASTSYRVTLTKPDFQVSQLFGQAFGSVLLNTANDRTIDTATTINVDLANATPALVGSAMPRVENLALDVSRDLVR